MKIINKYSSILCLFCVALMWGCTEEEASVAPPVVPSEVDMGISIAPDSSGIVTFAPSATNAFNFHLYPGDGSGPFLIEPGDSLPYNYAGLDSVEFVPSVIAYGVGAGASSASQLIEMFIKLQIAPETLNALAGGELESAKRWVWDANSGGINGHFGVGPGPDFPDACCPEDFVPSFFAAGPNLFDGGCLYDDVLTFSVDADGVPFFTLETAGETFINGGQLATFGGTNGDDACLAIDEDLELSSSWAVRPVEGESDLLTFGGGVLTPMSYYANIPEYTILELTPNKLRVRGVTADGVLAWYFQFVPEQ